MTRVLLVSDRDYSIFEHSGSKLLEYLKTCFERCLLLGISCLTCSIYMHTIQLFSGGTILCRRILACSVFILVPGLFFPQVST